MSNGFNIGGSGIQIKRDLGTPAPVNGFRTEHKTIGAKLLAPIISTVRFLAGGGSVRTAFNGVMNVAVWIKHNGVWKLADVWLNVSGVWKQITVYLKVNGVWK